MLLYSETCILATQLIMMAVYKRIERPAINHPETSTGYLFVTLLH